MKGLRVARRYARALLEAGADNAQRERWGGELETLARTVTTPPLAELLTSPEVSQAARIEAAAKIAEHLELSLPLRSFAVVVARHGRLGELAVMADSYRDQLDEMMGRARARLIFARKPEDADVAKLIERLAAIAGKTIIAKVEIDQSLLGGVLAELEGKTYDGSLKTQLAQAQLRLAG